MPRHFHQTSFSFSGFGEPEDSYHSSSRYSDSNDDYIIEEGSDNFYEPGFGRSGPRSAYGRHESHGGRCTYDDSAYGNSYSSNSYRTRTADPTGSSSYSTRTAEPRGSSRSYSSSSYSTRAAEPRSSHTSYSTRTTEPRAHNFSFPRRAYTAPQSESRGRATSPKFANRDQEADYLRLTTQAEMIFETYDRLEHEFKSCLPIVRRNLHVDKPIVKFVTWAILEGSDHEQVRKLRDAFKAELILADSALKAIGRNAHDEQRIASKLQQVEGWLAIAEDHVRDLREMMKEVDVENTWKERQPFVPWEKGMSDRLWKDIYRRLERGDEVKGAVREAMRFQMALEREEDFARTGYR